METMQPFISYHIRLTREYPSLTDVLITTAGDYKKISAEKMLTDSSMKQQRGKMHNQSCNSLFYVRRSFLFFPDVFVGGFQLNVEGQKLLDFE